MQPAPGTRPPPEAPLTPPPRGGAAGGPAEPDPRRPLDGFGSSPSPTRLRVMAVVWPSFLLAAVLEMLVFAFVDPHDVQGLERETAYTAAFFVFWVCTACACSITAWLLPVRESR